jgi:hypothetical protein
VVVFVDRSTYAVTCLTVYLPAGHQS